MSASVRVIHAPDVSPATRAQYQRALCLLPLAWPRILREHPETSSDVFVVVAVLLSMQPGRVIRQGVRIQDPRKGAGLAEKLGWKRLRVFRAIDAARELGLLLSVLHTRADKLPTGRHPRTNLLRYFVHLPTIERYARDDPDEPPNGPPNEPSDGSPDEPSTGSPRSIRDSSTPTPSRASCSAPAPSQAPPAPHDASETPPSALDNPNHQSKTDKAKDESESLRGEKEQGADQITALCSQWDALDLRNANGTHSTCGPSERSALANRAVDVGRELVELAIAGAATDPWLRRGGPRSALAWVMNDADSVRRYAERGAAAKRAAEVEAAEATAATAKRARYDAHEKRRVALWERSGWIPREAPVAFRKAMARGDYDAAEAMLEGSGLPPTDAFAATSEQSTALTLPAVRGSASEGPARISPTIARHVARLLDRAADLTELRGAAGQPLLPKPGANDSA
jgi:hypothetical protein